MYIAVLTPFFHQYHDYGCDHRATVSEAGVTAQQIKKAGGCATYSPKTTEEMHPSDNARMHQSEPQLRRHHELQEVFSLFDLDGSGEIEASELLRLGKARRRLGHKLGVWGEEKNDWLIERMDSDRDGRISASEFCDYFDRSLGQGEDFTAVISQFKEAASVCREETARAQGRWSAGEVAELIKLGNRTMSATMGINGQETEDGDMRMGDYRVLMLEEVFDCFDVDGSGYIEAQELLELGRARRLLGQKERLWTIGKNEKLVRQLDTHGSGKVSKDEFVRGFFTSLEGTQEEIDKLGCEFKQVGTFVKKRRKRRAMIDAHQKSSFSRLVPK